MSTPLTIDNYPHELHNQWAINQVGFDPNLLNDSSLIRSQAEIGVLRPIYISAHYTLFKETDKISWGMFQAPPNFFSQSNRFFGNEISPNLQLESILEVFGGITEKMKDFSPLVLEEFKKIHSLVECMKLVHDWLTDARGRIRQFNKG